MENLVTSRTITEYEKKESIELKNTSSIRDLNDLIKKYEGGKTQFAKWPEETGYLMFDALLKEAEQRLASLKTGRSNAGAQTRKYLENIKPPSERMIPARQL